MADTTTRRDVLITGAALTAAAAAPLQAGTPARFRVALAGDYEDIALRSAPWNTLGDEVEVVSFNKPLA